jgi:hypothetical protein
VNLLRTVGILLGMALPLGAPGLAASAAAQAPQTKPTVTASVLVAPPPVLLSSTRDLYFGSVSPGQVISVPARPSYPTGTWSSGVRIGGLAKTVRYGMRVSLPAQLANGTAVMPVSFNGTNYGWLCVWNQTTGTAGVCAVQDASFNPTSHTTTATALQIDLPNNTPQNNVFAADVYIGGQLSVPSGSLKPGTYSAPLTVTITVIG